VGEHWDRSLERLAVEAFRPAHAAAQYAPIEALYVANALGSSLAGQAQLGAHLAAVLGLGPIEAISVEAAGASGGVALRQAYLAVANGTYDCVAVAGVEKVTDVLDSPVEAALALGMDAASEAEQGLTLAGGWALLQRRYSYQYGYESADFAVFPVNAHSNGARNPNAMYRFPITAAKVASAAAISAPIGLLDSSTVADGAAVVILAAAGIAHELPQAPVRIAGSTVGVSRQEIQVADLSDQHGIVATLALESSGFVERGQAPRWAADGAIATTGRLPLATAGGCKARGDTVGALGLYQVVELTAQLQAAAGRNQVEGARVALAQCLGGLGATVATHILVRE
jgi:acetyl-CoA C-acetyltransferase